MDNLPKKGNTKDTWDYQVSKGECVLDKEKVAEIKQALEGIGLRGHNEEFQDWVRDQIYRAKSQLSKLDELIAFYENQSKYTTDYEEALMYLAKLKCAGKIKILLGLRIGIVIEGNLEIDYIKKCIRSVDNRLRFSDLFRCTDMTIEETGQPAYPDLHGDEMMFTADIRRDVVAWLQTVSSTE